MSPDRTNEPRFAELPDAQAPELKVACLSLRHKMMYVDERHAVPGMVDDSSDTRVFFCVKTHDSLGPDGEAVSPRRCTSARACYRGGA
jgi:hypothetical protein